MAVSNTDVVSKILLLSDTDGVTIDSGYQSVKIAKQIKNTGFQAKITEN